MVGSGTSLIEARLLNRNAIGYDINEDAVRLSRERLNFPVENASHQTVAVGDVRHLDALPKDSIDLVITHPPYLNLVRYSNGQNANDLSSISSLPRFLDELQVGIEELMRVLKPHRYCAILIGDTRRGQHYLPLSIFVLQRCLRAGFVLKEDLIKTQHNTRFGRKWSPSANHYGFYLIMHEHLFILRKPAPSEDLSRIRFSTWAGMTQALGGALVPK